MCVMCEFIHCVGEWFVLAQLFSLVHRRLLSTQSVSVEAFQGGPLAHRSVACVQNNMFAQLLYLKLFTDLVFPFFKVS